MTTCPACGERVQPSDLIKEWDATPKAKKTEIHVTIHYWRCPQCGHKFRTATRTWPQSRAKKGESRFRFLR